MLPDPKFTTILRYALIVAALPLASGRADQLKGFTWWIANPLTKVKPEDPVPGIPRMAADIYAGRNEFESFQLVLHGGPEDVPGIDVDVSDLRSDDGAAIPRNSIAIYFEGFINLTRPSSSEGEPGLWPDPLIPRVDQYAHEKRNAFPFMLHSNRNQPLWIEVYVPQTSRPGHYSGSARVSSNGAVQSVVPLNLTVWNFVLPSTSTLKSSFGLSGIAALKKHRGRYTSDEDLYDLTRVYKKAALLHRISTYEDSGVPPKHEYGEGRASIEWSNYDHEVGAFLDGKAISKGDPLEGAKVTSIDLRTPQLKTDDEKRWWWKEWTKHFQTKGWNDRLFLYLWDEPGTNDFPKVVQRGNTALKADPSLRTLVTTPFTTRLEDVVNIWVPLVNCLKLKPGFDDFCAETPPFGIYTEPRNKAKSLWFYQSCASHGCNIVGGSYFSGWPSYMIDMQGPANRVMQWVAWKFGISGELYYSMNEAYTRDDDPWTHILLFGGNGDGTLFYPGRPDRIGGHTDIPIESIRLKLIRDGMEDYEYLTLLAQLAGQKSAERYANQIVQQPWHWESQPVKFLDVRRKMGEELNVLTSGTLASGVARGGDAQ